MSPANGSEVAGLRNNNLMFSHHIRNLHPRRLSHRRRGASLTLRREKKTQLIESENDSTNLTMMPFMPTLYHRIQADPVTPSMPPSLVAEANPKSGIRTPHSANFILPIRIFESSHDLGRNRSASTPILQDSDRPLSSLDKLTHHSLSPFNFVFCSPWRLRHSEALSKASGPGRTVTNMTLGGGARACASFRCCIQIRLYIHTLIHDAGT